MPNPSPTQALWLADAILALHMGIVLFVAGLLPLVLLGGALGWRWVRHFGLRLTHLALMVFIAAQAWLGQLCPLTVWEQDLRRLAIACNAVIDGLWLELSLGQAPFTLEEAETLAERWLDSVAG